MATTTFSGPVVSTAGFISGSDSLVTVTASSVSLTAADHAGRTVKLSRAAGIAVTLPAASGTGNIYRLFVATTVTSNTSTVKVANASDTMVGIALMAADGGATANTYEASGTDDTITMDGSTTGGILGDYIELQDIGTNLWRVWMVGSATGAEADPFSATVS